MASDEEDVIIELSPNEYKTIVYATKSTFKVILAGKETIKKSIQEETQTKINVCLQTSSIGVKKRVVEIKGAAHYNVYSARQRVKSIVDDCQKRTRKQPTHFTCVKITDPKIEENFIKFKEKISKNDATKNLPESVFMRPEKLHITFGVMLLSDEDSNTRAIQLLNECLEKVVSPIKNEYGKIEMIVRGIDLMKGNPSKARVVYAKIESESLQKIANGITQAFIDAGISTQETAQNAVKLHMTVMNVKYAKGKVKFVDATHILEQYADFEFGLEIVNQIHLVAMQARSPDGFYKYIASIEF